MSDRYRQLFDSLEAKNEKAFIPFFMLADPNPEVFFRCVQTAISHGADALELGIGFSDPVADGPVIEKAHQRAIAYGGGLYTALESLRQIRENYPTTPIGILTYASMVFGYGVEAFMQKMAEVGVDSVLVADCPRREAEPLLRATGDYGIAPIFIAPPGASQDLINSFSQLESGYIYLVSRPGVTGVDKDKNNHDEETRQRQALVAKLHEKSRIPIVQGFGISKPSQVQAALKTGVDGVICGSALVQKVADFAARTAGVNQDSEQYQQELTGLENTIGELVCKLKKATRESA